MAKAEETAISMATPTLRLLTEREAAPPVELVVELVAVSWMVDGICPSVPIHEFILVEK